MEGEREKERRTAHAPLMRNGMSERACLRTIDAQGQMPAHAANTNLEQLRSPVATANTTQQRQTVDAQGHMTAHADSTSTQLLRTGVATAKTSLRKGNMGSAYASSGLALWVGMLRVIAAKKGCLFTNTARRIMTFRK